MKVDYTVQDAVDLFSSQTQPWWIAGGWAIDLFLTKETREHEDIDISILRDDEKHFRKFLSSWELWPGLGNDGLDKKPIEVSDDLPKERDVLWCRPSPESKWAFELLTSKTEEGQWLFKRDESIRMHTSKIGLLTDGGIPYLRPEIILLFKAKNVREKDQIDFDNCRELLNEESKSWLKTAIEKVHPGHTWLNAL